MNIRSLLLCLPLVVSVTQEVYANEISDLQDKKKLEDARSDALNAEAKRIKAESDLKKAVQEAAIASLASESSLSTQEVNTDFAKFQALKTVLGTLPEIGKSGNLTIGNTDPILLTTRYSSALSSVEAGKQVCEKLKAAQVKNAAVVPEDFQSKLIEARWLKSLVKTNKKITQDSKDSVPTTEFIEVVATTAVAAKYLIGVAQDISKLVRTDRSLTAKDDFTASRRQIFEWVLPVTCNSVFSTSSNSMDRIDAGWSETQQIAEDLGIIDKNIFDITIRKNNYLRIVSVKQRLIDDMMAQLSGYIACSKDEKKPDAVRTECTKSADAAKLEIANAYRDKDLAIAQKLADDDLLLINKITPWLTAMAANTKSITEAGYWLAYENSIKGFDWVSYALESQDIQQIADGAFTGKRLFGTGTVEVRYKAIAPDGATKIAGVVSITQTPRRLNLDKGEGSNYEQNVMPVKP